MKKSIVTLLLFSLWMPLVGEEDFSFAYEGSELQRERLSELQGSSDLPELNLTDWENSSALKMEDLEGKIVVLDFWATWCGPCIRSIPHANKIHENYADDVVFIGICHPRGSEQMKKVMENRGIKYPIAIDADEKLIEAYAVNGYPDYYIIDREGTLVVADCANSKVDAVLEKLLEK